MVIGTLLILLFYRSFRFYIFTKPVDEDEVPDYRDIIKEPMDLETMMTKIDQHEYECAQDFLRDIDLICTNALEYNPDRNPEGGDRGVPCCGITIIKLFYFILFHFIFVSMLTQVVWQFSGLWLYLTIDKSKVYVQPCKLQ